MKTQVSIKTLNSQGVNLSSTLKPMHPKVLHGMIVQNNAAVFNNFIEFPKPILIAANGPAIGAWSVEFHNHIN
jgi:enoyl-CoA hydratase/carnithine racemase